MLVYAYKQTKEVLTSIYFTQPGISKGLEFGQPFNKDKVG